MIRIAALFAALAALTLPLVLAACDILGPIVQELGAPACEPATGQTYSVVFRKAEDKVGAVTRAKAPHTSCTPPTTPSARIALEVKTLCLVADGSSLRVAWDAESGAGAAYRNPTQLPGCSK